jgi:Bacterial SH3 domain
MQIMSRGKIFFKLTGIAVAAAFILSACNTAATTVAPLPILPAGTATPLPVLPSATATSAPVATETPIPTIAASPTALATATPTTRPAAQVIPNVNANCRRGPGTDYAQITILTSGNAYDVIGRNDLNTWWLVQLYGGVECWTGAPGTTLVGSVADAPIVTVPVTNMVLAGFGGNYNCDTGRSSMRVTLYWAPVDGATGYRLFRNGVSISKLGPTDTTYVDNAPMSVDLVYELVAFDNVGSTPRASVFMPACG